MVHISPNYFTRNHNFSELAGKSINNGCSPEPGHVTLQLHCLHGAPQSSSVRNRLGPGKKSLLVWNWITEGRVQRRWSRLFSVVPSDRTRGMGKNWNTGGSAWPSGNTFSLLGWPSTGTDCSERLWSLPSWRYSKAIWTWSWATGFRCPYLSRRVGPRDLQSSLPTSTTLDY